MYYYELLALIKERRRAGGFRQKDIADHLNISESQYIKIERGFSGINLTNLVRVIVFLKPELGDPDHINKGILKRIRIKRESLDFSVADMALKLHLSLDKYQQRELNIIPWPVDELFLVARILDEDILSLFQLTD